MKKNVLILSSVHRWDDTRIFHKQAMSLAKYFHVELHAISDFDVKRINGITVKGHKRGSKFFPLKINFDYLRICLSAKATIIHFHDPNLIFLGIVLKLLGKKVIYDVHEDYTNHIRTKSWIPKFLRELIALLFNIVERLCSYFFDEIIVVTEKIAWKFRKYSPLIIYNYPLMYNVTLPAVNPPIQKKFRIIYAGSITRERGIPEVIESLKFLEKASDWKLVLIGKIQDKILEDSIFDFIKSSPVPIDFMGQVSHEIVREEIYKSNAGLVCLHSSPYYMDSLPTKMFEYMQAGIPVICSNFPLWRDIIEKNECGLTVDPLDPADIARALNFLVSNPDIVRSMGEKGKNLVKEKYNWNLEEKKLIACYEGLF